MKWDWDRAYAERGLVMVRGNPQIPRRTIFESKVERTKSCWLWTGSVDTNGYGRFSYGGAAHAHRAAWLIYVGPIPAGLHVCHRCDVPLCVRVSHLFLGTDAENKQDMIKKNRQFRMPY